MVSRPATLLLLASMALLPLMLAIGSTMLLRRDTGTISPMLDATLTAPRDLLLLVFGTANLFAALLGVLSITSEYSTQSIMRTYQVFRRRRLALSGKLASVAVGAFAASLAAVGLAIPELLTLGGEALALASPWGVALGFVANGVLVALFGLGVGLILSRTLPSVLTVVTFLYILPELIAVVMRAVRAPFQGLEWYLPTEASGALAQSALRGDSYTGVAPGWGLLVALVEVVILLSAGFWIQGRRDVT